VSLRLLYLIFIRVCGWHPTGLAAQQQADGSQVPGGQAQQQFV
jgi:hypothetical protein